MTTLAEARKKKGWTQAKLAENLGVYASAISMYESGERSPSVERFREMAQLLDVPMDELVLKSKGE